MLERESRAWHRFEERYRRLLNGAIVRVLNRAGGSVSSADVDEVYAELITSLLRDDMRKLRVWDPSRGARLGTWLVHVAVNAARNFVRSLATRRTVHDSDLERIPSSANDPLDAAIATELRRSLTKAIELSSKRDRDFIALYFGRHLSPEQIAVEMGINVKTVYTKKQKLLARLVATLDAA